MRLDGLHSADLYDIAGLQAVSENGEGTFYLFNFIPFPFGGKE